ncbi:MAG: GTP cyclohydrolase I FolE [Planctomycetes bacterium]|nr:GTP cyclohydrolase I FolE [Planctomycetota bacterium]
MNARLDLFAAPAAHHTSHFGRPNPLAPAPLDRPSREATQQALRTLLAWLGEDPTREGLLETPDRVLRAYGEYFAGYQQDPTELLKKSFEELEGYSGPVVVRDIEVHSHCEHHMVPFTGRAHVAYLPNARVVGLSKLARVVDAFARRLQIQERLTAQIAHAINDALDAKAVAVVIACEHQCMATRGVKKRGAETVTTQCMGLWATDFQARTEVLRMLED